MVVSTSSTTSDKLSHEQQLNHQRCTCGALAGRTKKGLGIYTTCAKIQSI